jgi:hypothetical protein
MHPTTYTYNDLMLLYAAAGRDADLNAVWAELLESAAPTSTASTASAAAAVKVLDPTAPLTLDTLRAVEQAPDRAGLVMSRTDSLTHSVRARVLPNTDSFRVMIQLFAQRLDAARVVELWDLFMTWRQRLCAEAQALAQPTESVLPVTLGIAEALINPFLMAQRHKSSVNIGSGMMVLDGVRRYPPQSIIAWPAPLLRVAEQVTLEYHSPADMTTEMLHTLPITEAQYRVVETVVEQLRASAKAQKQVEARLKRAAARAAHSMDGSGAAAQILNSNPSAAAAASNSTAADQEDPNNTAAQQQQDASSRA